MDNTRKIKGNENFETTIRQYLVQGKEKLDTDLAGTREAIKLIARDKIRDYIQITDRGFDKEEREMLHNIIVSSMHQAFCFGYGIGKIEGKTDNKVYL